MAQVLTDKDGNPLWIPAGTPGRDQWAKVIYGISEADALKQYYENFGQWFPYYVASPPERRHATLWDFIWTNLKVDTQNKQSFRPVWIPFWLYYGFIHEQELDEYLSQYAYKLRNFDWANPLKMAYLFIDAIVSEYSREISNLGWPDVEEKTSYLKQDAETAKQLLAAEYLYYLGPIKFALKANLSVCLTDIYVFYSNRTWVPSSFAGGVILPLQHVAWRDFLIFQTADGRQLKYIVSGSARSTVLGKSPDELRIIALLGHQTYFHPGSFAELLQMLQLPTIAWIEARDETTIPGGFYNLFEIAKEIPPIPMDQTTKVYVPEFSLQYALQPTAQTEASTIAPPPPPTTTTPLTTTISPTTTTAQPQPTSEVSAPTTSLLPSPTIAPTSAEQSKLMGGLGTLGALALAGIILLLLLRRK
jgi:hypothetical protein